MPSALAPPDGGTLTDLRSLAEIAEALTLQRGDVLMRQGEPSEALYFVLSGRFTVHVDGTAEPVAEIGQGQSVGEIGFFAGLPRNATVVALRDSTVLMVTRERFATIGATSPGMRDAVILSLARRLADRAPKAVPGPLPVRTVAVLAAGASAPPAQFVDTLRAVFAGSRTLFLAESDVARHAPAKEADISTWLNSQEAECEHIFYLADPALSDWTRKCIRQADALLLVAEDGAPPALNPTEHFAFGLHRQPARHLAIVHPARSQMAAGTAAWLEARDVFMHHHVALQDAADVRRLARFLSGRAVGFVAGGGGALGSAHLGVYKAFCEAGVDFDILGGTSVGAAMMAAFACGADAERVDEGTRNIFVKSRAFRRPTLPRYGLIDHKVFDRALRNEYGDARIEDLWRPFFAVSSDLSGHRPYIHRRGPVWQAVRASGSIPGVLPPFFTRDGEMLVDGALMDNVPLAPMKALKRGPNVVVMLGAEESARYSVDYDAIPGPAELAALLLNPFARRRLPPVPNILQVIMLSMMANRPSDLPLTDSDVLIRPQVPDDLRFTHWERHNEVFRDAYRGTAAWIAARQAEQDPKLGAIIGSGRTACATRAASL